MDLKIEKVIAKQSQLEKKIEKLYAEKKILLNRICVLNECLSHKKLNQKIAQLEKKQSILKSLENVIYQIRIDIKPLDYLKQLLQKNQIQSSPATTYNDVNFEEQNCPDNSLVTTNSECAIETLDSLSDVGSEGSVVILSEYDIIADEEIIVENTDKTITNKVVYDEALQMASSMHSLPIESPTSSNDCNESLTNVCDKKEDVDCYSHSNAEDSSMLMNTRSKIKQLLETYDVVKKKDLINCTENAKMKLGNDKGKIESIIHEVCTVSFSDETLGDVEMSKTDDNEHDNVPKLLNSWVKVDSDELVDVSLKNNIFLTTSGSLKDNTLTNENLDLKIQIQNDELCKHQYDSKGTSDGTNLENIVNYHVDYNLKNEVYDSVGLAKVIRDECEIKPSLLNIKCSSVPQDFSEQKVNTQVENLVKNDELRSFSTEFKENSELKHFQNVNNHNMDHNYTIKIHDSDSITKDSKNRIEIDSPLAIIKNECNDSIVNIEVKTNVPNDYVCSDLNELKKNCELNNVKYVISNNVDNNSKNKVDDSVCLAKNVKDKHVINLSTSATKFSNVLKECNEPRLNIEDDIIDNIIKNPAKSHQFESDNESMQSCHLDEFSALGLNIQLVSGIHQHGIQRLMTLQQQCISHCINGRDIVLHSYPCTGKSTMCLISILHRINTRFNVCQAIILVPTLELALFTQKIIKSLGKFLNVSTCVGGFDNPNKLTPVPHVVISSPQIVCDMINSNSLSRDFIKVLIIDDADEMMKTTGFFHKMRHILLYLKGGDFQQIIMSTSKLEDILDQFSGTMQNPEYIILPDEKPSLGDVLQYYASVSKEWKVDALCELYDILNFRRTVVFCNTWNSSLVIANNLRLKTCTVSAVHNKMDTSQRCLILRQFQSDVSRVLITTELLKGEDFSEVVLVVNYDLPKCPKDYIRRIVHCFSRRVKVINLISPNDETSKENIESTFNINMLRLSQNLTDFN